MSTLIVYHNNVLARVLAYEDVDPMSVKEELLKVQS